MAKRRGLDEDMKKRVRTVETRRTWRGPRSEVAHLYRECRTIAASATVTATTTCQVCLKQQQEMLEAMIEGRAIMNAADQGSKSIMDFEVFPCRKSAGKDDMKAA